eukprot:5518448-Alexandrium_andersonii.AAC.1
MMFALTKSVYGRPLPAGCESSSGPGTSTSAMGICRVNTGSPLVFPLGYSARRRPTMHIRSRD